MEKQFYKLGEVAELLGKHYNTIYQHIQKGLLKANKVGGEYMITKENLDKYLKGE